MTWVLGIPIQVLRFAEQVFLHMESFLHPLDILKCTGQASVTKNHPA